MPYKLKNVRWKIEKGGDYWRVKDENDFTMGHPVDFTDHVRFIRFDWTNHYDNKTAEKMALMHIAYKPSEGVACLQYSSTSEIVHPQAVILRGE